MLALEPDAFAEGVAHYWHSPCAPRGSPLQCPPRGWQANILRCLPREGKQRRVRTRLWVGEVPVQDCLESRQAVPEVGRKPWAEGAACLQGGSAGEGRYDVTHHGAWRGARGRASCPEASPYLRHTNRCCATLHGRFVWGTVHQWTTRSRLDLQGHAVLIPRNETAISLRSVARTHQPIGLAAPVQGQKRQETPLSVHDGPAPGDRSWASSSSLI